MKGCRWYWEFLGLLIEHETCFSSGRSACLPACLSVCLSIFVRFFRVFAIWLNFNFCICKPIRKLQTEYWKLTENCKQLVSCSFNLLRPAGLVEFSSSVAHLSHTRTAQCAAAAGRYVIANGAGTWLTHRDRRRRLQLAMANTHDHAYLTSWRNPIQKSAWQPHHNLLHTLPPAAASSRCVLRAACRPLCFASVFNWKI